MAKSSAPASTPAALVKAVRAELRRNADPAKAPSDAALHEVGDALLRRRHAGAARDLSRRVRATSTGVGRRLARGASRRCGATRGGAKSATPPSVSSAGAPTRRIARSTSLPLLEEMIVDGAWWDYVDPLATHRLRELLVNHPKPMSRAMRAWSRDANLWKRRSAILCQVGRKRETDLDAAVRLHRAQPGGPGSASRESSSSARPSAGLCATTPGTISTPSSGG